VTATGYTSGDPRKLDRTGYTKGDVVASDAAGALTAIPAGVDGLVLTTDSADAEGVQWLGGGGGGGGTPSNTVVTETAYAQASAAGVSGNYSRGDHTHGTPALTAVAPATTEAIGTAAAVGVAAAPARADHVHPMAAAGAPSASTVGDTQATGVATTFAASDHRHAREVYGTVAGTVAAGEHTHRQTVPWNRDGTAAVVTGTARWYNRTGATLTVAGVWCSAGTPPTGADLVVDVNKNGVTLFTTQANRPKVTAGTNGGVLAVPDVTTVADGDYLTCDIDVVGSGTAGADITVGVVVS
jgi:hypothetical protein